MKKSILNNLNPEALATWPVFLITLAWGVSTNLLDTVFNPEGLYLERILGVIAGNLTMFGGILIGLRFLKLFSNTTKSILMIPLVAIVSVVRGFTVWLVFLNYGIDSPEVFNYRVFGPITNIGIPLLLSAYGVQRIRAYSKSRKYLLAENQRLSELRDFAQEQLKLEAEQQLGEIRATVRKALSLNKGTTVPQTISAISSTINDVVKPLTETIEPSSPASSKKAEVPEVGIDWKEAFLGALSAKFLKPLAVSITLLVASALFVILSHTSQEALLILFVSSFATWFLLSIVKFGIQKLPVFTPSWLERVLFLLGVISSGVLVGVATLPITLETQTPLSLLFLAPHVVTGITLLIAIVTSAQAQANAANDRLLGLRTQLAWEISRVSSEQRQLRRAVASLLHGRLQSGLTSALMKLKLAKDLGPEDLEKVGLQVQEELKSLIDSVRLQSTTNIQSLSEILESIRQTWSGLAEITLDVENVGPSQDLENDPVLMSNLSEIIAELSFNAIKHGQAKRICFSLSKSSPNTAKLVCHADGTQTEDSGRIGLGTKLLDECAIEWSREPNTESHGTKTKVLMPFVPSQTG